MNEKEQLYYFLLLRDDTSNLMSQIDKIKRKIADIGDGDVIKLETGLNAAYEAAIKLGLFANEHLKKFEVR